MQDRPHEDAEAGVLRVKVADDARPKIPEIEVSRDQILNQDDEARKAQTKVHETL